MINDAQSKSRSAFDMYNRYASLIYGSERDVDADPCRTFSCFLFLPFGWRSPLIILFPHAEEMK